MLKLCRLTKVKVLFLVLAYIFNLNLFEFSAAILEKGLFFYSRNSRKRPPKMPIFTGHLQESNQRGSLLGTGLTHVLIRKEYIAYIFLVTNTRCARLSLKVPRKTLSSECNTYSRHGDQIMIMCQVVSYKIKNKENL